MLIKNNEDLLQDIILIRDNIYSNHRKNKVKNIYYTSKILEKNKIFESPFIKKLLKHFVCDDSYKLQTENIFDFCKNKLGDIYFLNLFSGSGRYLFELENINKHLNLNFHVYNVDLSINMTANNYDFKNFKYITFLNNSVTKINIKDNLIDFIICHGGIRYLKHSDYNIFIEEMKRVIKKDGVLYISESIKESIDKFIPLLKQNEILFKLEKVKLKQFRCNTLYLLYNYYNNNKDFRYKINLYIKNSSESLEDFFIKLSGYKYDYMYGIKIWIK